MALYMKDKKSNYLLKNTLASAVLGMIGKYTVVDLRNEASVRGKIVEVDGYMNVEMEDCVFRNPRGEFFPFSDFFISARNVRYIHVPNDCTAQELITKAVTWTPALKSKKQTFKEKRSKVYQAQILDEIQTNK